MVPGRSRVNAWRSRIEQRLLIDPGWIRVDPRSIRIDPDSTTVRSLIDPLSISDRPPTACRSQVDPGSARDEPDRSLVDPHRARVDNIAIRVDPLSIPSRPPTGWQSRKDPGSSVDRSRVGPGSTRLIPDRPPIDCRSSSIRGRRRIDRNSVDPGSMRRIDPDRRSMIKPDRTRTIGSLSIAARSRIEPDRSPGGRPLRVCPGSTGLAVNGESDADCGSTTDRGPTQVRSLLDPGSIRSNRGSIPGRPDVDAGPIRVGAWCIRTDAASTPARSLIYPLSIPDRPPSVGRTRVDTRSLPIGSGAARANLLWMPDRPGSVVSQSQVNR